MRKTATFYVYLPSEGGRSWRDAQEALREAGVEGRKTYSPYVGHYGIEVPKQAERKASRVLFG